MNDDYAGHGGSYLIDEGGNRILVERTQERALAAAPAAAPIPDPVESEAQPDPGDAQQKTRKPASAGFFSSVAKPIEPVTPVTPVDEPKQE